MKLLLLNPNTSPGITVLLAAAARGAAAPGTVVTAVTAPRGFPYIASRAEAAVAGAVVLEMLAEGHRGFDAAIIAAFGDPGLGGAREMLPIPVVGLAEAGMLTACMLGARFALVTFTPVMEAWYQECVASHGLRERCAGVFALSDAFGRIEDVQADKEAALIALAGRTGADVVVLAGAPLAGLAAAVRDRVEVPLVDCAAAAVKQAEALVALGVRKAAAGSFRRPGGKASVGLPPALARWMGPEAG